MLRFNEESRNKDREQREKAKMFSASENEVKEQITALKEQNVLIKKVAENLESSQKESQEDKAYKAKSLELQKNSFNAIKTQTNELRKQENKNKKMFSDMSLDFKSIYNSSMGGLKNFYENISREGMGLSVVKTAMKGFQSIIPKPEKRKDDVIVKKREEVEEKREEIRNEKTDEISNRLDVIINKLGDEKLDKAEKQREDTRKEEEMDLRKDQNEILQKIYEKESKTKVEKIVPISEKILPQKEAKEEKEGLDMFSAIKPVLGKFGRGLSGITRKVGGVIAKTTGKLGGVIAKSAGKLGAVTKGILGTGVAKVAGLGTASLVAGLAIGEGINLLTGGPTLTGTIKKEGLFGTMKQTGEGIKEVFKGTKKEHEREKANEDKKSSILQRIIPLKNEYKKLVNKGILNKEEQKKKDDLRSRVNSLIEEYNELGGNNILTYLEGTPTVEDVNTIETKANVVVSDTTKEIISNNDIGDPIYGRDKIISRPKTVQTPYTLKTSGNAFKNIFPNISGGTAEQRVFPNNVVPNSPNLDTSGVKDDVWHNFVGMSKEYGELTGKNVYLNSAYRSYEDQVRLFKLFGPGRAARPGRSMHGHGVALDINSDEANEMERLGLLNKWNFHRPVSSEDWHIEPSGIDRTAIRKSGISGVEDKGVPQPKPRPSFSGMGDPIPVEIDSEIVNNNLPKKNIQVRSDGVMIVALDSSTIQTLLQGQRQIAEDNRMSMAGSAPEININGRY